MHDVVIEFFFTCSPNWLICLIQRFFSHSLQVFSRFMEQRPNVKHAHGNVFASFFFDDLPKHTLHFCFLHQQFNMTLLELVPVKDVVRPLVARQRPQKFSNQDRFLIKTNTALLESCLSQKADVGQN